MKLIVVFLCLGLLGCQKNNCGDRILINLDTEIRPIRLNVPSNNRFTKIYIKSINKEFPRFTFNFHPEAFFLEDTINGIQIIGDIRSAYEIRSKDKIYEDYTYFKKKRTSLYENATYYKLIKNDISLSYDSSYFILKECGIFQVAIDSSFIQYREEVYTQKDFILIEYQIPNRGDDINNIFFDCIFSESIFSK